jgi:diguanylate cyclase (GGDEF)-like protein
MDQPGATNVALLWVSMVGFTVLNMVFAFVIIASLVARLDSLSREDALTGLNNRRAFNEVLAREWSRRTRESSSFSLVAFDIDHFKRINDQHGHAVGDEVLVQLAQLVSGHARQSDYVARVGGEEFVMLLPSTGVSGAALLADRLREAVLYADWPKGHRVTISVGVACSRFDDVSAGDLLVRADQAMYQAKARGRNQTIVHSPLHSARPDGTPASAKTPALFA